MENQALPICENFRKKYNEVVEIKKRIKLTLRPIEQELLKEELNDILLGVIDCVHAVSESPDCEHCKSLMDYELRLSQSGRIVRIPG